ncbi:MAG: DUF4412 domain-containing protein [Bacteroidetes bacterium]|nr:DUF4412 domain-containing protein [Bacteroidota bacterium]
MLTIKNHIVLCAFAMVAFPIASCNSSGPQKKSANAAPKIDSPLSPLSAITKLLDTTKTSLPANDTSVLYHAPLPDNYIIPVTGNGNDFLYQYYGGSIFKQQKNGVAFSLEATQRQTKQWNVLFKGFGKLAAIGVEAHYSFLLNDTYTRTIINDDHQVYTEEKAKEFIDEPNYKVTGITVTKAGEEKLHGFNCVHAKITGTSVFMHQTMKIDMDIWRSMETPGAALLESTVQTIISPFTTEIENKLQQINCKGAIIKAVMDDAGSNVTKELYSITKKNIPDSVFDIPAGYKEDKNTELYFLLK